MGLFGNPRSNCNCQCKTAATECLPVASCETVCTTEYVQRPVQKCETICTTYKDLCEEEVESCECNCECNCSCSCKEEYVPQPMQVRAMLDYVLDSCCTTEDVGREIVIEYPQLFDPTELEVGCPVDVDIPGDILFKEVKRRQCDCDCLSTVRFTIPIRIYGTVGSGCTCNYIDRDITVIRSANLCCANDSILQAYNSKAIAISAVVSAIDGNAVTLTLCIVFRSCLQQTILREFTWTATPICSAPDCNSTHRSFIDDCDMICGCADARGGRKKCASCK